MLVKFKNQEIFRKWYIHQYPTNYYYKVLVDLTIQESVNIIKEDGFVEFDTESDTIKIPIDLPIPQQSIKCI